MSPAGSGLPIVAGCEGDTSGVAAVVCGGSAADISSAAPAGDASGGREFVAGCLGRVLRGMRSRSAHGSLGRSLWQCYASTQMAEIHARDRCSR